VFAAIALLATSCVGRTDEALRVGAIYPLSGAQGPGGVDEHRGVLLAAELATADDVFPAPIEVESIDAAGPDAAPGAVARLHADGVRIVLGSYGSTLSARVAQETASRGMLFWETGAVGMLPPDAGQGSLTFRVAPAGAVLGGNAIAFVADRLAGELGLRASELRYSVVFVDDAYGRSVAEGALAQLEARGLTVAGRFGYDFRTVDADRLARRLAAARTDVLFASSYLADAVELRRALVAHDVPLVAGIGTSSSYCMPEFGDLLGADAVGLFASDKPAAAPLDRAGLSADAARLLDRANTAYRERWDEDMSPAALAGFAAAWALFAEVLPLAPGASPDEVADAARRVSLPRGALPNGSGLRFGPAGGALAGENVAAASVIWQWVAPGRAEVVWPPAFATHDVSTLAPAT
jgi:branched-chain amino acid transport system substrate-binding protein